VQWKKLGLITGIVALLNPRALEAGMVVMIGVVLDRSTPDSFAEFEKAFAKVSGCMECHVITGEFDYFMIVRTRDNESFNRLHAEQLLHLPGVRQIRSFMGLKQVLSTTQFPARWGALGARIRSTLCLAKHDCLAATVLSAHPKHVAGSLSSARSALARL
jgi:DNA-binding Lrp family transcriptional regulator